MKTSFSPKNLAIVAALAVFLLVPGMARACQVSAASPLPYSVPAAGMVGAVTLSAQAGCPWTFTARGYSWIRILSATSGSGSAVVYFQILPNTTGRARAASFGPEGVAATPILGSRSSTAGSTGFSITVTENAH
jgi:hypothetical protein